MTELQGVLVMWSARGFGFIRPANGSEDVFVGAGAFEAAGIDEPEQGERFFFVIGMDRSGRSRAEGIRRTAEAERQRFAPVRP